MSQGSKVMREDVMEGLRKGEGIAKWSKTKEVVETVSWKQKLQHTAAEVQRTKSRADEEGDRLSPFLEMHLQ